MSKETTSEAFFEAKYQRDSDPWNFASDAYEQSRYQAIIASLQGRLYQRAFEPGCSIGVLTQQLAGFCGQVVAMDISESAVARARERCVHLTNVLILHGSLPGSMPDGDFDLIVLSEIGYYFDSPALSAIAKNLVSCLATGGVLLGAHWLGHSPDHEIGGDQVHQVIHAVPGLRHLESQRRSAFRLDKWIKA